MAAMWQVFGLPLSVLIASVAALLAGLTLLALPARVAPRESLAGSTGG
jgi:hypothetical protein